jgi:hypothetical protein
MKSVKIYLSKENVKKLEHICKKNKEFLYYEIVDASDKKYTDINLYYINVESLAIVILNGLSLPKN